MPASPSPETRADAPPAPLPCFSEAARTWARIAALSFGGPAGQIAVMNRILVEEKGWVDQGRFLHALSFCMLLPGPEAQQLATYLGWLMHGVRGGFTAGLLFILPGALAIMALSVIYAGFGQIPVIAALFYGLKAAVLAIVIDALIHLARRAFTHRAHWWVAALAFLGIFVLALPFPLIVALAACAGFVGARMGHPAFLPASSAGGAASPPIRHGTREAAMICALAWAVPVAALLLVLGPDETFSRIATFFSKMAVVTFGGAYAALAYVAQAAVADYGWLRPGEMLDGLALAETTPGPLIMVLQFVGFLAAYRDPGGLSPMLAGALGGLLATWVTFAPCFLWIFAGAPFIERLRGARALGGALKAVTAAVVGVILNLALWFALHTLFVAHERRTFGPVGLDLPVPASLDPWIAALTLAALAMIFRWRLGLAPVLAASAIGGILLRLAQGAL